MDKKPTIGVFFGSRSPEHDVSIITGELIISGLKGLGYDVVPVYIGKNREWYIDNALGDVEFFRVPGYESKLKHYGGWNLSLGGSKHKIIFEKQSLFKKTVIIDIAFPAFHGRNGEDGTIQGMFEFVGVPYIGCGVLSSALTMDKVLTKELFEQAGIQTPPFVSFTKRHWKTHKKEIQTEIERLKYPLFVKPARTGSSIGITKVTETKDLEIAIEVAFHYDTEILVEEGIENMSDLTCSVIGHKDIDVSLVQESLYSKDLFSYDDKYIKEGGAQTGKASSGFNIPPHDIDPKVLEKIQLLSKNIFSLFGCSGIARVDFLYDNKNQKLYANEINTLPGTLYHHLWKESGINLASLLERLIHASMERYEEETHITNSFNSSILQRAKGSKLASKLQSSE